jgi:hypothetical protein
MSRVVAWACRAEAREILTAFRKASVAEVSGFSEGAIHQLGDAGENQYRGELSGQDVGLADTEVTEVLVNLPWRRQSSYTDAEGELWRMVSSHDFL